MTPCTMTTFFIIHSIALKRQSQRSIAMSSVHFKQGRATSATTDDDAVVRTPVKRRRAASADKELKNESTTRSCTPMSATDSSTCTDTTTAKTVDALAL